MGARIIVSLVLNSDHDLRLARDGSDLRAVKLPIIHLYPVHPPESQIDSNPSVPRVRLTVLNKFTSELKAEMSECHDKHGYQKTTHLRDILMTPSDTHQ